MVLVEAVQGKKMEFTCQSGTEKESETNAARVKGKNV